MLHVVWGCWHHWDVIPSLEGRWLEEAGIVEEKYP